MRALNSRLVLIDINSSWQASRRLVSATTTAFSSDSSSSFRRTRGARQRIASSKSPASSPSPVRRPSDGFSFDVRSPSADSSNSASISSRKISTAPPTVELDAFLEILPPATRKELVKHEAIEELIEVVMDLGRKPLARFPSGDWVISEQPVTHQDLKLAVSKVCVCLSLI